MGTATAPNDPYHAWVLRTADQRAPEHGPLAGLAFGVKDVFDVRGLPTRGGIEIDVPAAEVDAWAVAALRAAGAVPAGKTRTTAFAFRDPTITRNPRAPNRTPGGSSSGSAAAVAAGEVPFALGTQTLGSTLRPAAFCGIVGYKPTFGLVSTVGMRPLAPSLDHVGVLARDVTTALAVAHAWGVPSADPPDRVALAPMYLHECLPDEARGAVAEIGGTLPGLGIGAMHREHVAREHEMLAAAHVVNAFEAAALYDEPPGVTPAFAELLARGREITHAAYRIAREERHRALDAFDAMLGPAQVLVCPIVGPPPDAATTGDPTTQAPWTFLGLPAVSIPVGVFADETPRGVQLVARPGEDAMLLAFAAAVERALAPSER